MEFLEVDGSQGEGGGQVLRVAMVFSIVQRKPIRVFKIRAGRQEPGLKRQHVSALKVLAEVFDGGLSGAFEGSSEVTYSPGLPRVERVSVDMKTAASITLVLQAAVPAAALSGSRLTLELVGGTDVPWSPTFDYFDSVVRQAYSAIGIDFQARAERRGYYPRGGGRVVASVEPCAALRPLTLLEPPRIGPVEVESRCALLPMSVAERQLSSAVSLLNGAGIRTGGLKAKEEAADSPGSSVVVRFVGQGAYLGCDAIGARGKPSEAVGEEAASKFVESALSGANVDPNLADMLLPLLSLAGDPSSVRVHRISSHLETGLALARQFTGCYYSAEKSGRSWVVKVKPITKSAS